jgi:mRNA interferase RelE/StbE
VKVFFRQSFTKDLAKAKDKGLLRRVKIAIETLERAESLEQVKGLKKLRGVENYYRLRIGDFRLGLALEEGKVIFVRFLNRKEMYRYFP